MREVGKSPRRSKQKALEKLKRDLGRCALRDLSREWLIAFGKSRAKEGAGPVTIGMDLGYVGTVLVQATAIHGIVTPTDAVLLARTARRRLGLIANAESVLGGRHKTNSTVSLPIPTKIRASIFRSVAS